MADQQRGRGIAAGVVAVVAAGCGLFLAREVFIPVAVALLFYALLRPLVRRLERVHVPPAVSATVIVLGLVALLGGVGAAFSQPLGEWAQKAPETFSRARAKFAKVTAKLPFGSSLMGAQGGSSGSSDPSTTSDPAGSSDTSSRSGAADSGSRNGSGRQKPGSGEGSTTSSPSSGASNAGSATRSGSGGQPKTDSPQGATASGGQSGSPPSGGAQAQAASSDGDGSGTKGGGAGATAGGGTSGSSGSGSGGSGVGNAGSVVAKIFGTTASLVSTVVEVLLLLLFLLAMGDRARAKVMRAIRCYDDRQTAVTVAEEIEAVVSRYVVATALINLGQGIAVAVVMWALGLPTPALWGMLTFVFEFIPYLGALVMMLLLAVAGLTSSGGFAHAMLAPGLYLVITTLQNNLVSPIAYGNRLKLSPAAILVAVMIWWFLWGFAGAFVAVPVLAAVRVLADHVKALKPVGELIGD